MLYQRITPPDVATWSAGSTGPVRVSPPCAGCGRDTMRPGETWTNFGVTGAPPAIYCPDCQARAADPLPEPDVTVEARRARP